VIGKIISHYRILEELGRGGMGVVYKARDTKLGRTVALKFLSPQILGAEDEKARFLHEAQAAASLSHPNICTIHEIDEYEERSFIAMECVEGKSLRSLIEAGPLKLELAVDIAMQTAAGLQEAHEKGIIHRDIKPANIMITPKGRVKIMDFGLAKAAGRTQLTKEGTTIGTIGYMSPEQARGEEVDRRTDIWSLGVILYEMVTGRRPFEGDYEQAVIYSILNSEPEPLTSLRTGVPMELERVVNKALVKNSNERYQTAADLVADLRHLQRILLAETAVSREPARGKAPKRQYSWLMWVLLIVILTFVLIQLIPRIFPSQKQTADQQATAERPRIVVLPFENLGAAEYDYFADGITEEITSRLAAIQELGVISRKSALHYKDSDKTIAEIGGELAVDYVLEGTVRWEQSPDGSSRVRVTPQLIRVSDDSHIWADRYDEDFEAIFDIQTRISERVAAELDIALTGGEQDFLQARPTENTVAYQLYLRAAEYLVFGHRPEVDYQRAEKLLKQAIDIDPGFALAHAKLSHVHRSFYFYGYERTDERLAMAKAEVDKALELDPEAPEVRRELGYYYYQGLLDYDRALEEFMSLAVTLPNDAQLLQDIAFIWRRQGHFEQALANLETAYSMNPMDAWLCVEIAHTNLCLRRSEKALEYIDKTIAIAPESHWGYFIKSGAYIFGTGDVRRAWEASDACPDRTAKDMIWGRYYLHLLDRDYQAILDMFDDSSLDVIRMQSAYLPVSMLKGLACRFMGDDARAKRFYEEALEILEVAARENPEDPRIYSALGSTYAGLGRKAEAIAAGRKAVEIYPITRDAILGIDRMLDLSQIYARIGENEAAIELMREILTMPAIYTIHAFELDPRFDGLRDEPAYKQLVREFGGKQS
jgi:TolB-like protein/tRNA A-37 threonylcarbamoyl transferase component Bud32/Flp pilus assembly protein TadD